MQTATKFTPTVEKSIYNGYQHIYAFPNGYGASVINRQYSYGMELAVLVGDEKDFEITYNTPITNDVVGNISGPAELEDLLTQISELPSCKL
jgi:hypothetical protein